ncbi:MAG TPA: preprotein translocase subunit SecA [Firmicutes bacterium]|nr:preprotein translocase subunit SecA [Bacillota bacterium]
MFALLQRLFHRGNEAEIERLREQVAAINALEPEMMGKSDDELAAMTAGFRQRLANGATLDDLLPEAFAVVREASRRVLGQRHFDVQLMGGIVLHEGRIAEMKTGEGKTLAATAPAYLNALTGRGVHIVTVNDYLAKRDAEWMGAIYRFLGLTVGVIVHEKNYRERQEAYRADITYGTNNEFGFDYLRDNMALHPEHLVQRELNYAIIDEVDSILIDEARTPLIISGMAEESTQLYYDVAKFIRTLTPEEDYTVDEKARTAALTEAGVAKAEKYFGVENLYDESNMRLSHHILAGLKAHTLFKRDRDYVVKDGEVIIVDEFTGRLMFGRRYSDGIHQAIEAKEGVRIQRESQTLATITFQNYFRMYKKIAGMTGTAKTEEEEFRKIYGMDVVVIPTNKPMIRTDYPDLVFRTERAKWNAVVDEIEELYKQGRPVLVGTISIERSEHLSDMLRRRNIPHQVLNAKYHEREAEIIAQAGRPGMVTIATNMAGRGTDILLGGNPEYKAKERLRQKGYSPEEVRLASERRVDETGLTDRVKQARRLFQEFLEEEARAMEEEHARVVQLGGLHIIGTERHESRRIDNQLRGRSGRQGDPGSSRFYVSLEDDLMRLFGSARIAGLMDRLGWDENVPIEDRRVTRAIENAQKKVEARNFELRKQVLEYDEVMNQQRQAIYAWRRRILLGESQEERVGQILKDVAASFVESYAPEKVLPEEWDLVSLVQRLGELVGRPLSFRADDLPRRRPEDRAQVLARVEEELKRLYREREQELGPETLREIERLILLRVIDAQWMQHLRDMDDLREGIGLRAYGQQNPLVEYRLEAFQMFRAMMERINEETLRYLFRVQVAVAPAGTGLGADGRPAAAAVSGPRVAGDGRGRTGATAGRGPAGAAAAAPGTGLLARATYSGGGPPPFALPGAGSASGSQDGAGRGGRGTGAGAAGPAGGRLEPRRVQKVGRNDPCPCGSGLKYKKCHGRYGDGAPDIGGGGRGTGAAGA